MTTPSSPRGPLRPLSVAPMMDRTDRHFRWLLRRITRRTLLYTEMVHTGAVLRGRREQVLGYDPLEHPLALQLGGDDPAALVESARIAVDLGYDEVNLNIGCPSDRVQCGRFGAVLMREAPVVADMVARLRSAVSVPVTVKHRIGVDGLDRYEDMLGFVDLVAQAGCDRFLVHARIAILDGLSPRQNREIPPLRHADVWRLKQERPQLRVEINGGISTIDEVSAQLAHTDGVLVGRAAWDDPNFLADADRRVFGDAGPVATREEVARDYLEYVGRRLAQGERPGPLLGAAQNLFAGRPGTRRWKRALAEAAQSGDTRALREAHG